MRHVRLGSTVAAAFLAALVGCSNARTLEESASGSECARCHGFPPSAETGAPNHPVVASDATVCATCHSTTVAANGEIIPGGTHQNGQIDVTVAHAVPYPDHPTEALTKIQSCTTCHGSDYTGGSTGKSCVGCHQTETGISSFTQNCTFCHGTRTDGVTTATARAAPPEAVVRDDPNAAQKVGAHQTHLAAGGLAPALPCDSCHAVPTSAQALTHFTGGGARGAISFSALATKGAADAAYTGGICNVYCHGAGTEFPDAAAPALPAWTGSITCGDCHLLPPASGPSVNSQPAHSFHIAQTLNGQPVTCGTCHPALPAQHVNGTKDVIVRPSSGPVTIQGGWNCSACHDALGLPFVHGMPFEAQHTPFALADLASCTGCHGADFNGAGSAPSCTTCHQTKVGFGDWQTNCTFCHGTRTPAFAGTPAYLPAPPQSVIVTSDQSTSNPRIGAHQKHVGNQSAFSNGVACTDCHPAVNGLAHIGGSGTAQVAFGALATTGGAAAARSGQTCSNYCHGVSLPGNATRTAPTWSPPSSLTCASCHGAPPTSGHHSVHLGPEAQLTCARCHGTGYTTTAVVKATHVNGTIEKVSTLNWNAQARSCSPGCHDTRTW